MKKLSPNRMVVTLAALVLLGGCAPAPDTQTSLNLSSTPSQSAFGVLGNGAVATIVPRGNVTYVGGNFDELAAITGAFARLDAATARRIAPLAEAEHGEVRASAPDGNGGFYVGGTFTSLGGEPRARIGHILANGNVDPNFNPGVSGQNSAVNALAVSGDGTIVYVGGGFATIGGQPRNNLAALEAATGKVTNFNPAGLGTDGQLFALEVAGTQVYVGGQFEKLGGQTRHGLAKVAGTTGGDLGWIPNPTFGGGGLIFAIEAAGTEVYVGGVFTSIGGQARTHLAKLSATTGSAAPGFTPNPDDAVWSIVLAGPALYVGGDFNSIGGAARNNVATLNPKTGAEVTGFNPNVTGGPRPQVHGIAVTDEEVYVGGSFTQVGGQPQGQIARLTKTGALTPFDPKIRDQPGAVLAVATSNTALYAGGLFFEMNRRPRLKYAQFPDTSQTAPVAGGPMPETGRTLAGRF